MAINRVYVSDIPPVVLKNPGRDGTSGTSGTSGTDFNGMLPNYSDFPQSPDSGSIFFNTSDSGFYGWNGNIWRRLDV
jgi:hypothetical protein